MTDALRIWQLLGVAPINGGPQLAYGSYVLPESIARSLMQRGAMPTVLQYESEEIARLIEEHGGDRSQIRWESSWGWAT